MRRKIEKEINIFSISTIDLLTSTIAVFLILAVVAVPRMRPKTDGAAEKQMIEAEKLAKAVQALAEVENNYLNEMVEQYKTLNEVDLKITELADLNQKAMTKVQGVERIAETLKATQNIVTDLLNKVKTMRNRESESMQKLQVEQLKTSNLKKSIADLKESLEKKSGFEKPPSDRFVAVLLRWDTPQHDVDLQIVDPSGRNHSFKNKDKDAIMSDSTRGPGAEIWYMKDPKPGKYAVRAYFHGRYGNKDNAKLRVTVVDTRHIQIVPELELDKEGQVSDVGSFDIGPKQYIQTIRTPAGEISVPDAN